MTSKVLIYKDDIIRAFLNGARAVISKEKQLNEINVFPVKDAEIAKRINQKMMDKESGIDLLEAEKDAESDAIKEREEALARELAAMKKRKSKLVDPIQYAF